MGVGGKFWDLLKPCAKFEGPDFLREKRVAIDLSYWVVQHETAIRNNNFLKPHLRLTFFRTINIFSKFGAYPVFVVDGTPSPLKSHARILRFLQFSGFDVSSLPVVEEGVSAERNPAFLKCVQECVELLELFGMPVLRANGEAEALCAQLNREGHVDACITADSDAFLYGAQCVIKSIKPNTKEPFECYRMSDIETGLGLRRKQLIAISLLVGNDHDLNGVQGIGIDTALRVVRSFSEDDVLDGLREIGNRKALGSEGGSEIKNKFMITIHENLAESRLSHCSFCGHPGSKREHFQSACQYCVIDNVEGCLKKPERFKCNCDWCAKDRKVKEHRKYEKWKMKVCQKIAVEPNFPNEEIIEMYMCTCHGNFTADNGPWISWGGPNTDMIVDFLVFHHLWNPAYIRQRMLPMLSTIYLREMTSKPNKELLNGQYEFDCIQRVKVRYGHQYYVTRWKKATPSLSSGIIVNPVVESDGQLEDLVEIDESSTQFDGYDAPQIHIDGGLLLTDENIELIRSAFPQEVDRFSKDKELKESRKRKPSSLALEGSESKGVQLSITEFYRSTKVKSGAKQGEEQTSEFVNEDGRASKEKRDVSSPNLSKSFFSMIAEKALSLETCRNADQCIIGVSVLVIDCDSACLTIVSTMLRTCGYNVVTAKRAKDAFSILLERGDEFDLILTEVNLPDMDKFELLEKFFEISSLPVVVFSADDGEGAMLGSLFKGAVLYLVKPIGMNDIKNLWQFLHMKKLDSMVVVEGTNNLQGETSEDNTSSEALESQSVLNNREQISQQCKRKGFEIMDKDEDSTIHKKPKLRWSNELHNRFLQAIDILGIDDAHPKKILQHMNVPGLRKENVSSHLQKYRLSLKQQEETKNKRGIVDHHPSSVTCEQCQFPQCLNTQAILKACQSEFANHFLPNVGLSIAPCLGASQSLHNRDSSHISFVPEFGEFDLRMNQPYVHNSNAAHVESRTASSWELTNSGQMRNHEAEHCLRQKTYPSNIRHSVSKSAFLGQEMSLPVPQPPPPQQEQEDNNPENETETTQL